MPSKTKPLSSKELAKFEAGRDLGAELLQSIREMKAGKVRVAYSPATEAREKTGLSQSQFAALLGVSVRTLHRRWVEVQDLLRARLAAHGVTSVPEGFSDAADAMELREESEGEGRAAGADVSVGERGGIAVLRAPKKDGGERA